jgi:hypothetical protein
MIFATWLGDMAGIERYAVVGRIIGVFTNGKYMVVVAIPFAFNSGETDLSQTSKQIWMPDTLQNKEQVLAGHLR